MAIRITQDYQQAPWTFLYPAIPAKTVQVQLPAVMGPRP